MRRQRHHLALSIAALLALAGCQGGTTQKVATGELKPYPTAHKDDVVDTLHGTEVADPYRWMENVDAPEVKAWVDAENDVTFTYLEGIEGRDAIAARLRTLWNYERDTVPDREGDRTFWFHNDGLQPQSVLLVADDADSEPRVLLDPNTLSEDGTVALSGTAVSWDGSYLAYALSSGGSDWKEWHVRSVDSGEDLGDVLEWSKFSGASWSTDDAGFYYTRYDAPAKGETLTATNRAPKLMYHRLGTPQSDDRVVYERPDQPEWGFGADVTEDGRYLVISVSRGTDRRNRVFYRDLAAPGSDVVELIPELEASYSFVGNDGPVFYFRTDRDAPRGRVVAVDTRTPDPATWRVVVPEQEDTLRGVSLFGDTVLASYLHDAHTRVRRFSLDGTSAGEIELPGLGSAHGFSGRRNADVTFYAYESFATPATVYRYDLRTGESTVFRAPEVAFDPADFVTEQVFYTSKDGTRVPMFVTRRRDVEPSASTPALLYGYGGFDVSMTPRFSVPNVVWMEMGGIYCLANLRGGGEYGEAWHEAGMKKNKQNVFDDFIAAAEYLEKSGYTSPGKLAIEGGSNGGLLVGAVLNQRPDLFGAALPAVGVMDMLRFHKFTIGWAWVSDYGSPDDPEMFPVLRAYSPYHNITPGTHYPATLITTADHDDRVVPAHSFKYAAALQAAQGGDAPILIRIETRAGHGAGKPVTKRIEESADALAFLVANLDMPKPQFD